MKLNLLTDPLIQSDRGRHSLPGLMAAMARGEVAAFPALRPHQRPAWHMFLAQLATLALAAAGRRDLPEAEADWAAALRALTPGHPDDAPWHLVVEDRSKPAFLQPADPGGLKWSDVPTPDALDMLITARNHDLKTRVAQEAAPQDWIFALVSVQTMEGFGGAGNYGIARMNGGSSSRVVLSVAPADDASSVIDPSRWWGRDVRRLLAARAGAAGKALIWIEPWPEGRSLPLDALDPLFVEVCRRVRTVVRDGALAAERSTSKAVRIAGKEAKGVICDQGDPWAPVHIAEAKTLTLGERDWTYRLLVELLYGGDWRLPPLARPDAAEERAPMVIVAEAFARGNSRTDGFRSRIIPVPKGVVPELFGERAVSLADAQIEDIARVDRALRDGLALVAAEGDYEKRGKEEYARAAPARAAFQRFADRHFFDALWQQMQSEGEEGRARVRLAFIAKLSMAAEDEFHRALTAIPCARIMRTRAELRGARELKSGLRKTRETITGREAVHA